MKFQIGVGLQPLQGYILLDVRPLEGNPQFTGDIAMLPCDDGECTEILAENIINFVPPNELDRLFSAWNKKLRVNHQLIINGMDIIGLSRMVVSGEVDINTFNKMVYQCGGLHSRETVLSSLLQNGFKLVSQKSDGLNFTMRVTK